MYTTEEVYDEARLLRYSDWKLAPDDPDELYKDCLKKMYE